MLMCWGLLARNSSLSSLMEAIRRSTRIFKSLPSVASHSLLGLDWTLILKLNTSRTEAFYNMS
jgi:hypothetical protein